MKSPLLTHDRDSGALLLRLDFGKGNILDTVAMEGMREAVAEAGGVAEARALIVSHSGDHFSFGASVEDHLPESVESMLTSFHALVLETLELDLPILAAARGQCLGGGLEVALLADRVFVALDARLGQPEIRLAVFAPVASALLSHRIGSRNAADLLLTGRSVGAEEALAIGLVDDISAEPEATAGAWVTKHLSGLSGAAIRYATRAARTPWMGRFREDLAALERLYLDDLMGTRDALEGLRAFLERRDPVWSDR